MPFRLPGRPPGCLAALSPPVSNWLPGRPAAQLHGSVAVRLLGADPVLITLYRNLLISVSVLSCGAICMG